MSRLESSQPIGANLVDRSAPRDDPARPRARRVVSASDTRAIARTKPTSVTRRAIPAPSSSLLLAIAALPMLLFLLLPVVALILQAAPGRIAAELVNPQVSAAVTLSVTTTAATALLVVLAGTPLAYLLARRRFLGHGLVGTLVDLPMVLPPAVAGVALLVAFGREGLVGHYLAPLGITLPFTPIAVILAQTFVAAPYYLKAAAAGFAAVDREVEQAAALDRASPLEIFAAITVPLAAPSLLGGMIMTWARALGEFGATIIFAGNFPGRTQTMPLAIYLGFQIDLNVAISLAAILLATSFLVLFLVKIALRPADH